jgi:hypothetical protein
MMQRSLLLLFVTSHVALADPPKQPPAGESKPAKPREKNRFPEYGPHLKSLEAATRHPQMENGKDHRDRGAWRHERGMVGIDGHARTLVSVVECVGSNGCARGRDWKPRGWFAY